MKTRLLFISLLAATVMAGCSKDETINDGRADGDMTTNYVAVNIVTASSGTRAVDANENYEDGTDTESTVNSVRFYFFDAEGNAVNVKKNETGMVNYLEWESFETGNGTKPNIEKVITAQLIIETEKGDAVPSSIIAIINPPSNLTKENMSISSLNDIVQNYKDEGTFVMSNSVYASSGTSATKMEAVSIENHMFNASAAALANPVNIYVERVLAKVRLTVGNIANAKTVGSVTIYPTNNKDGDNNDVYVKFLGWNVTATADKSRLMKNINPAWKNDLFNSNEPWNYAPFYRSFWAVNPENLTYGYGIFKPASEESQNGETTGTANTAANFIEYFDAGTEESPHKNYTYVQENASSDYENGADPTEPTQVIIAAQLVNKKGQELNLAEWGFRKYTVDNLKTAIISSSKLYKKTQNNGITNYTPISVDDITFKTVSAVETENGVVDKTKPGRYYVYAQLTDAAETNTWTNSDKEDADEVDANKILQALGHAKIWKEGMTYYYFNIQHLNQAENSTGYGKVGVVRNHLYNAKINSLTGLGTPVYDPTETIYPEKPTDDETYVAAEIKVLSWRIVNNNIELEW